MKRFLLLGLLLAAPLWAADYHNVKPLPLGSAPPDFDLPGVDGRNHSLKEFSGAKILVVLFTCTHCPTAQAYQERVKQIVSDYKAKGVAVVAIMPNDPQSVRLDELGYTDLSDTFEEMKIRAADQKFNYPYLFDGENEKVSLLYGPAATPQAFVFDESRKLRYSGRIDDSEREALVKTRDLRSALDALLAGREPDPNQTKTFGCSIKWGGKADDNKRYMDRLAQLPVSVEMVDVAGLKALRKNEGGKLRLVNIWATWCGPCVTEFPDFIAINRMYGHREFEMITVSANYPDEKNEVLKFLKKEQSAGKNLLFGDNDKYKLAEAFDKDWNGGLPLTLLLNPDGTTLYREEGAFNPLQVKRLIVKNLKEDRFK
jgi:thiol-disulfide isomerase/thioredoxin